MVELKSFIKKKYENIKSHKFPKHFRKYKDEMFSEFFDLVEDNLDNENPVYLLENSYLGHSLYLDNKDEKYRYYGNSLKRALKRYLEEGIDFIKEVISYVRLLNFYEKAKCKFCQYSSENIELLMTKELNFICVDCIKKTF